MEQNSGQNRVYIRGSTENMFAFVRVQNGLYLRSRSAGRIKKKQQEEAEADNDKEKTA